MPYIKPTITNKQISRWFIKRKLEDLAYQNNCITKVNNNLFSSRIPTVLAACPSAGKTSMAIAYVEFYLDANPKAKVLILTHGTKILRSQFLKDIEKSSVSFSRLAVEPKQRTFDAQVIITLPQTLRGFKKLPKFDLLIVDEAHHFYFAAGKGKKTGKIGLVTDIIKKIKPKHQLLLTGTPSIFIRNKFNIIPVTIEELLKANRVTDVIVELASSSYDFKTGDFNQNYDPKEISAKANITQRNTNVTMDELLTHVLKRLTSAAKNNPKLYANVGGVSKMFVGKSWADALGALEKTMIACNSIDHANMVKNYLEEKGIKVALSTSENDVDSDEIERFVDDRKCLVLIVVDRGVLGFNLPELENVIDMTCSYNPDKIFQLMGRVLRKHPKGKQKLFFKVVPTSMSNLYRGIMQVVALLSNKRYYTTFDGKNMLDAHLFAELEVDSKPRKKDKGKSNNKSTKKKTNYVPINFDGVPFFKIFNDLLHEDNNVLNGIAYVTLRQVIDRIKGYHATIEDVIAELEEIHNG